MPSLHPVVYVVLLNWCRWPDTIECLRSLKKSNYLNLHVLVVDNASSDDSVSRIGEIYPDVHIIQNKTNLGFGGGCNVGIKYALAQGAEYIWLLNNDTKVSEDALVSMVDLACGDSKHGAVGSVLYYMDTPSQVQAWGGGQVNLWTGLSRHFHRHVENGELDYLTAASILLRREAILDVGLFDEKKFFMYWEDVDLCFRLRRRGWKLAVAPNAHVWHKESASLRDKKPLLDHYFTTSAVRFYKRHAPLPVVPITLTTFSRILKRIIKGEWSRVRAVWAGVRAGFGDSS